MQQISGVVALLWVSAARGHGGDVMLQRIGSPESVVAVQVRDRAAPRPLEVDAVYGTTEVDAAITWAAA
jgi:hypothetical protein